MHWDVIEVKPTGNRTLKVKFADGLVGKTSERKMARIAGHFLALAQFTWQQPCGDVEHQHREDQDQPKPEKQAPEQYYRTCFQYQTYQE